MRIRLSGWVLQESLPWGQDGRRAWLRWTERLLPEPKQRVLVRPEQQKPRRVLQVRPGLRQQVPGPGELRDPERALRDVILPTGQAP